jgi:hypothetical protein
MMGLLAQLAFGAIDHAINRAVQPLVAEMDRTASSDCLEAGVRPGEAARALSRDLHALRTRGAPSSGDAVLRSAKKLLSRFWHAMLTRS